MRSGFSLVELSIVLVILGLLTGGILTGQNLIRAAELRSVTTEFQAYQTAVNTFRDKYFAIPGDLNNASDFWAASTSGNGDGTLDSPAAVSTAGETFGFWQQLALAGLIEGSYDGTAGAGGVDDALISQNVPDSKVGSGGWSVLNVATQTAADTNGYYEGNYGNMMFFGSKTTNDITSAPVLSSEETWNVDTKIDDGRPGTGALRTLESQGEDDGTGCGNLDTATTALIDTVEYDVSNESLACTLIFRM